MATTNVRQAYEKSLRCFELYMRSGSFARDLEADTLPPAGQTFSRTQLIRIWDISGKGVPDFVTFSPYNLDADGDPMSAAAAAAAAASAAAGGAVGTARSVAAAAAAIGVSTTAAASAAAVKELPKAAPKPELKMVPQGPEPTPPSQDPPALVNKQIWRMWEGHGWFPGVVSSWDAESSVHEVVFAKGTPQQIEERMNLLAPPVTISWRDPKQLVSATAAAIAKAAQYQCTGTARSNHTSASGTDLFRLSHFCLLLHLVLKIPVLVVLVSTCVHSSISVSFVS